MTHMTSLRTESAPTGNVRVPFLTAIFAARTWKAFAYLLLMFLIGPLAVAYAIVVFALSASLLWTVVGLYISGAILHGARGWGVMYRAMASTMLDTNVAAPARYVRPKGFWSGLGALFVDGDAWRALLFMVLSFPLAYFGTLFNAVLLVTGVGAVTYPAWRGFVPAQQAGDGTWHRGSQLGNNYFVDTPANMAVQAAVGVVLLLVWPWGVRAVALLFGLLSSALLGPTRSGQRVAALRATRAAAVTNADARLRGIERDLHDGPQARLVAVAMQLGEARALLATGTEFDQATVLVESAHASTKETLSELREIVRGIHPPALDAGLVVALETLAARAPLAVHVDVDPALDASRPLSPAQQSLAYYVVAELLANIAKHSGAETARVELQLLGTSELRLRVSDDGRGGAKVVGPDGTGRHTGLAGLTERVAAVDGQLSVTSPLGGPTVVTVIVPIATKT